MVTVTKPVATSTLAERLLAAYRLEEEHWAAREMFEDFLDSAVNITISTAVRCASKLDGDCSTASVRRMAAAVLSELVEHGHADEVEAFLDGQASRRNQYESGQAAARLRADIDRLARQPDGLALLEVIQDEVNRLLVGRGDE